MTINLDFAKKTLKALEAAIEGRANQSMQSMTIGGKAVGMMSLTEQLDCRERLLREINGASRQGLFKTARVRFDV